MRLWHQRSMVAAVALVIGVGLAVQASAQWLLEAPDDEERWRRVESYVGGFSTAMAEVGRRFESVQQAIVESNWDLALYHWDKVKGTIDQGTLRRPGRLASAEALFLETEWLAMRQALEAGDREQVWRKYDDVVVSCKGCHQAENVAFINDQAMFRFRLVN